MYLKYPWFTEENININELLKTPEYTHAGKLSAWGKATLSWTEERRLIVIYSEGEIAQKNLTKIGCCVTVNDLYIIKKKKKPAVREKVPGSVFVGVELGGTDEGDVCQKDSCCSSML